MTVWSFCPIQIRKELSNVQIKNKGTQQDLDQYRIAWVNWIKDFSGAETKKQWAITNGIHDAIINQVAHVHTRYNIILSYPDEGGDSIYNSNINKLEENMVWKCEASKFQHGSTVVRSEKPRVTLSIGFLIKEKQSIY